LALAWLTTQPLVALELEPEGSELLLLPCM
jgi:hypothetical protein